MRRSATRARCPMLCWGNIRTWRRPFAPSATIGITARESWSGSGEARCMEAEREPQWPGGGAASSRVVGGIATRPGETLYGAD